MGRLREGMQRRAWQRPVQHRVWEHCASKRHGAGYLHTVQWPVREMSSNPAALRPCARRAARRRVGASSRGRPPAAAPPPAHRREREIQIQRERVRERTDLHQNTETTDLTPKLHRSPALLGRGGVTCLRRSSTRVYGCSSSSLRRRSSSACLAVASSRSAACGRTYTYYI